LSELSKLSAAVVVPCFNESMRIDIAAFNSFDAFFLFVDDGSTDGTADLIREAHIENSDLLVLEKNQGKAEAVRQGMIYLEDKYPTEFDWYGFFDADLATPLEELGNMVQFVDCLYRDVEVDAVWGSRCKRLGASIERGLLRHYLGRVFVTFSSWVLGVRVYDSQCGAKLFRSKVVKRAFGEQFVSKWIFDIEVLLRLSGCFVVEYPLLQWKEVGGSKVNIKKELPRVLGDLLNIRKRYKTDS
jgi:dolichyl-phosphate beta-glucosyltransferase